ncbi:MAG: hypothetical protein AAF756_05205 [Pseudomonadota bacterium]
MVASLAGMAVASALALFLFIAHRKHILPWLPFYLAHWFTERRESRSLGRGQKQHVIFCFVDHFEPRWGPDVTLERERERVALWTKHYPELAREFVDADGCHPKHSFFFPIEEYEPEHLYKLQKICAEGLGEIEVHLHHDNDTAENLRKTLLEFTNEIHERFGALSRDPQTGELSYGFIHGNWVLDNSGKDGRWCGVNNELQVLGETGCYADFTFPAAPHPAQPRQVNSIYYAIDDPERPKSHDLGIPVKVGGKPIGDLLLITGPLSLNWRNRKFGIMPRIENSDLRSSNPPTPERVDSWISTGIRVRGRPDWVFVKVHTHGASEKEAATLLGESVRGMHAHLRDRYNDGEDFALHYVSAREMFNIVKAAEAGERDDPGMYRDYVLPKPSFRSSSTNKHPDSEKASTDDSKLASRDPQ